MTRSVKQKARHVEDSGHETDSQMFSAASYAGVLNEYRAGKSALTRETELGKPPVVAFYGFRGGAGRTTALGHIAAILSGRQVQVVVIDLDLEAPGLHHVLRCSSLQEDRGVLALLREAATAPVDSLSLAPHVLRDGLDLGTPIRVLPAGLLSQRYLERLEDLGVPLWHIGEGPSPLQVLVDRVKDELAPQVVLLDCRTGLSGLSASAIFHIADAVVCFLPITVQSLEGLDLLLMGVRAARLHRHGRPGLLLVPTMVPEGPEGQTRLEEWFLPELEQRYTKYILGRDSLDDQGELLEEIVPVVRAGIEYRRGIALADHLRSDFVQRSAGAYGPLMQHLEILAGLIPEPGPITVDADRVLSELDAEGGLKKLAFAETTPPGDIVKLFVKPSDFNALVDRGTWYVVGAKGAGKTWLWTYLMSEAAQMSDMSFLAGHGPGHDLLSSSAMRELEREARLAARQTHGAFWLLYAARRLLEYRPQIVEPVLKRLGSDERRLIKDLVSSCDDALQAALLRVLRHPRAGTLAERVVQEIDRSLLESDGTAVTLLYDNLDVGFGSDSKSIERRQRFVNAFVEAIEPLRGRCRRVLFKVFLREDIFSELNIQNQSHLEAAKVELRWEPRDLWVLALNLAWRSEEYRAAIHAIDNTVGPDAWPAEEERRQRLLTPLWGAQLEAGNKVSTALFVQRRTADGKERLFPRTLVQLLAAAVDHQSTQDSRSDRVLRSAAIQVGYKRASENRVNDLRKEYAELGSYLDGLKGMTPTGTERSIVTHIRKMCQPVGRRRGARPGTLQAGPGGWHKIIERLMAIGVLREYRRARDKSGRPKLEIALLYRPGLGIKSFGV
ncbi:MAG: ParA family protein [Candidatus Riflebacteria bacterium]|nr:ParA family protein [Candidatus Riflebacteria bacterium]